MLGFVDTFLIETLYLPRWHLYIWHNAPKYDVARANSSKDYTHLHFFGSDDRYKGKILDFLRFFHPGFVRVSKFL